MRKVATRGSSNLYDRTPESLDSIDWLESELDLTSTTITDEMESHLVDRGKIRYVTFFLNDDLNFIIKDSGTKKEVLCALKPILVKAWEEDKLNINFGIDD